MHLLQTDMTQFEAMCVAVGEWDQLPTVQTDEDERQLPSTEEQSEALEERIFASLVCPY